MQAHEDVRLRKRGTARPGLTVYGCDPDEAERFEALAPGLGVALTATSDRVSLSSLVSTPPERCVSIDHRAPVSERELRALSAAGVEYLSSRSIGLDHIDVDAAARLGMTVGNVAYAPDAVADFTVMLILMATRGCLTSRPGAAAPTHDAWSRARGRDLGELTVGVVGTGRIGSQVIRRLGGFGCRLLSCGSRRRNGPATDSVPLGELLRRSDVVTLHVPLDADTYHLIGRAQIASMPPGAVLVNTARGLLVDSEALLDALESGRLGGAALDVVEGEPGLDPIDRSSRPADDRIRERLGRLPNVIVSPHVAYRTIRTLDETVERTLTNCLNFTRSRV